MRVLVVGAGAIGSLVGGRLALADNPVTLVGREWLRQAIAAEGLTIVTGGRAQTVRALRVVTGVAEASPGDHDLIILTMKAYGVAAAVAEIARVLPQPPPLLTLQNGIGSETIVAARFGPESVIAGTLTTPVEVAGPARIETVSKGGIGLAPLAGTRPDPTAAAEALAAAGFVVARYAGASAMKWSKLLLNIIGNATSAILAWPPARIFADPRLYAVELNALAEARRVMAAHGIATVRLPGYPVPLLMMLLERLPRAVTRPLMRRQVARGRGGKMPSLSLDLEAGREQLEIDVLNGAVVAAGAQAGVATPVNRALAEIVQGLAAGRLDRARFRHNPEALLASVHA
ncbi:MAG: 2-dehydropantoate 2-reductase [Ardenticatenaceae bacterium]|nr:2-dehydropantoate 2-reductase [Ardenticatenaceae bacterium]